MAAETLDIRAMLREVLAIAPGGGSSRIELQPLPGGCTNETILATVDAQRYVVRIASPRSGELRICRENEFRVWQAAAAAGIAPIILHRDHDRGVLIYKFVEGYHWVPHEIERPGNLDRLGQLLRATHSLAVDAAPFDPIALGLEFHRRVPREQLPTVVKADWPARVRAIGERGTAHAAEPRLCHNDPVRANFIDAGTRLWLIDWESAGTCDPYYDLATVAHNNRLSVEQEADLLQAYEKSARPDSIERLARMKVARDFYHVFWFAVQLSAAATAEEFRAGCTFHAERLANELRSFDDDGSYLPSTSRSHR